MIERLLHRLLENKPDAFAGDDDNDQQQEDDDPSSSIVPIDSTAPSTAPIVPPAPERNRVLFFSTLIILFVLAVWCLWNRMQKRNEQRRLDYRSAQADRVLGDMQMVPNADLDNELL